MAGAYHCPPVHAAANLVALLAEMYGAIGTVAHAPTTAVQVDSRLSLLDEACSATVQREADVRTECLRPNRAREAAAMPPSSVAFRLGHCVDSLARCSIPLHRSTWRALAPLDAQAGRVSHEALSSFHRQREHCSRPPGFGALALVRADADRP